MALTVNVPENHHFDQLFEHFQHEVLLEPYQEKNKIWLECAECNLVLVEFVRGEEEIEDGDPNNSNL